MGYKVTTAVWDNSKAKGGDLLVLIAIADSADNETGEAFPSIRYLAEKSRLSERTVQYAITRLVSLGELEVLQNTGRVNTFRVTLFLPGLSAGEEKKLIARAEESAHRRGQGGARIAPPLPVDNSPRGVHGLHRGGCTPLHGGGAIHDITYNVFEPVIEPETLSPDERACCVDNLKRIFPSLLSIPEEIPMERAYLFLCKVRTGEIKRENIRSPVAYMLKMRDENISKPLRKEREQKQTAAG